MIQFKKTHADHQCLTCADNWLNNQQITTTYFNTLDLFIPFNLTPVMPAIQDDDIPYCVECHNDLNDKMQHLYNDETYCKPCFKELDICSNCDQSKEHNDCECITCSECNELTEEAHDHYDTMCVSCGDEKIECYECDSIVNIDDSYGMGDIYLCDSCHDDLPTCNACNDTMIPYSDYKRRIHGDAKHEGNFEGYCNDDSCTEDLYHCDSCSDIISSHNGDVFCTDYNTYCEGCYDELRIDSVSSKINSLYRGDTTRRIRDNNTNNLMGIELELECDYESAMLNVLEHFENDIPPKLMTVTSDGSIDSDCGGEFITCRMEHDILRDFILKYIPKMMCDLYESDLSDNDAVGLHVSLNFDDIYTTNQDRLQAVYAFQRFINDNQSKFENLGGRTEHNYYSYKNNSTDKYCAVNIGAVNKDKENYWNDTVTQGTGKGRIEVRLFKSSIDALTVANRTSLCHALKHYTRYCLTVGLTLDFGHFMQWLQHGPMDYLYQWINQVLGGNDNG